MSETALYYVFFGILGMLAGWFLRGEWEDAKK